jgi:carbamoyltransferase
MKASCLGPEFSSSQLLHYFKTNNITYEELSSEQIPVRIADLIAAQKTIGWFQGRMEFGPRALGARSIIGDARSSKMQEIMNLKIKFRESFRPFAPSVLWEKVADYFSLDRESPYMMLVAPVKENIRREMTPQEQAYFGLDKLHVARSVIPAVTHVDYSARVQTVTEETNPLYYGMIKKFDEKYGTPVIINTSFNVRGEPIVCSPEDAYMCFMRTNMDYLIMGNYLLNKEKQKPLSKDINWLNKYEND